MDEDVDLRPPARDGLQLRRTFSVPVVEPGIAEPILAADSGLELGYLALIAGNAVTSAVQRAADELGVTTLDVNALYVLAVHGPLPAGTLAQCLGVQPAAVTGLALRLERLGWIERERDVRDRRRVWVKPTAEAERVVTRAVEIVRPAIWEVFGPIGRGPALALATLLSSVVGPWLADRLPAGTVPGMRDAAPRAGTAAPDAPTPEDDLDATAGE